MSFDFTVKEFILGNGTGTPTFQFYRRGFNLGSSGSGPSWQDIILSGNGSLTLTNAKANGLNYLKLFGGTEQRNLPAGHTQLEYVYMTSGSYIKIEDLLISAGYKIEYNFQTTTLGSSLRNFLGGRANGVSAGGGVRLSKLASGGTTLNRVVFYGFESGTEYYAPEQFQPNTRYKYTYNNGVCTLESGGSVVSTQTFTVTDNTSTKWGINTYVSNNDYWQTDSADGVYVYSLKVWNPQGELVMDLVPDLTSSNVVCFYDTVTGNIREATGGTFEAGTVTVPTPDTPIDIVCNNGVVKYGVLSTNLLDLANCQDGYYYTPSGEYTTAASARLSNYIPVKAGVTYTVGLTGIQGNANVRINLFNTQKNWLSQTVFVADADTEYAQTITPTQDGFLAFTANYTGNSYINWSTAQVVQGSYTVETMPEYEPYRTGIYTDGTVETVEVTGKNLFDQATATRYQTSWSNAGSGYWQAVSDSYAVTYGCYVKPNTTYTLSKKGGSRLIITGYTTKTEPSSEQTMPADYKIKTDTTETIDGSYTFTTPVDCTWILFGLRQNNSSFTFPYDVQLELGSTATDYEPYFNGGTATAEMLLKVGDYQDVQSVLDGEVTRNIGIKVFDGTETGWVRGTSSIYIDGLFDDAIGYSADNPAITCSHFKGFPPTTKVSSMLDLSAKLGAPNQSRRVYFVYDAMTTASQFQQFLANQYNAGTPVIIVYPLATPTTETVTAQPLTIQAGTNIVEITQASIDNLGLEVSYKQLI